MRSTYVNATVLAFVHLVMTLARARVSSSCSTGTAETLMAPKSAVAITARRTAEKDMARMSTVLAKETSQAEGTRDTKNELRLEA